jgi:hypothetical protein
VRSLPPEAEGIEKFVVGALYDLADPGYPTPQTLGPHLAGVAFGRADKPRSVAPEPPEVVICPLETLVDHDKGTVEAEPTLPSLGFGRALAAKKVSAACWSAVEAAQKQKPVITPVGSTAVSSRNPSYHPRLLLQPTSAHPASHPCPRRLASRVGIAELSSAS